MENNKRNMNKPIIPQRNTGKNQGGNTASDWRRCPPRIVLAACTTGTTEVVGAGRAHPEEEFLRLSALAAIVSTSHLDFFKRLIK